MRHDSPSEMSSGTYSGYSSARTQSLPMPDNQHFGLESIFKGCYSRQHHLLTQNREELRSKLSDSRSSSHNLSDACPVQGHSSQRLHQQQQLNRQQQQLNRQQQHTPEQYQKLQERPWSASGSSSGLAKFMESPHSTDDGRLTGSKSAFLPFVASVSSPSSSPSPSTSPFPLPSLSAGLDNKGSGSSSSANDSVLPSIFFPSSHGGRPRLPGIPRRLSVVSPLRQSKSSSPVEMSSIPSNFFSKNETDTLGFVVPEDFDRTRIQYSRGQSGQVNCGQRISPVLGPSSSLPLISTLDRSETPADKYTQSQPIRSLEDLIEHSSTVRRSEAQRSPQNERCSTTLTDVPVDVGIPPRRYHV